VGLALVTVALSALSWSSNVCCLVLWSCHWCILHAHLLIVPVLIYYPDSFELSLQDFCYKCHQYKLYKSHCSHSTHSRFFAERVMHVWNCLPPSVDYSTLATFRRSIDVIDFTSSLKCDTDWVLSRSHYRATVCFIVFMSNLNECMYVCNVTSLVHSYIVITVFF